MAKFRMKTVEIEAAQVCRLESKENDELLATQPPGWLFRQERIKHWGVTDDGKIVIGTSLGTQHIKPGNWIVQRSDGTLHVLDDEEFKTKYEPVADEPAAEGEIPKRDECGSERLHRDNDLIGLFELAFQETIDRKNNINFENIVRSAFEQVQENHNEIKNQWFSRGWQLAISLADEYKIELGSRRFVDAMGAMLDLSNTIIKILELKSSESKTQNEPEPPQENPSSEPLYYLQSVSAGCVGNSPQFWRQGDSGYTAWISVARKFTANEIKEIIRSTRGSHEFAAWHVEMIDMIADKVVDMQELRGYKPSFTTQSVNSDRQTEQIIDANGPTN